MAVKKSGSKNNIANRGAKAKIKFYGGKKIKEARIIDENKGIKIIGAVYENGDVVTAPDGNYVKYSSVQEFETDK